MSAAVSLESETAEDGRQNRSYRSYKTYGLKGRLPRAFAMWQMACVGRQSCLRPGGLGLLGWFPFVGLGGLD